MKKLLKKDKHFIPSIGINTEIQEGRKKKSNFLILASDEVCDQIFAKNKENIDIMWHWQEVIRFSEFESMIIKYIN